MAKLSVSTLSVGMYADGAGAVDHSQCFTNTTSNPMLIKKFVANINPDASAVPHVAQYEMVAIHCPQSDFSKRDSYPLIWNPMKADYGAFVLDFGADWIELLPGDGIVWYVATGAGVQAGQEFHWNPQLQIFWTGG